MTGMTIRSTASDGCWLDGIGGLARGVAMASNVGAHGDPLIREFVGLDVPVQFDPGSDGAWLAWGLICPRGGQSLKPKHKHKGRRWMFDGEPAKHFNCRCTVQLGTEEG